MDGSSTQGLVALGMGALQGVTELPPISSDVARPKRLLETKGGKELLALFCACVPAAVIGLLLEPRVLGRVGAGHSGPARDFAQRPDHRVRAGVRHVGPERFSFLLSIAAIAGAIVLKLGEPGVLAAMDWAAWLAAATSFVVGYVALRMRAGVLTRGQFWLFSPYLVPLGAIVILLSFFRS